MQLLCLFIFLQLLLLLLLLLLKQRFLKETAISLKKKSASKNEKINSRSAVRSNTYPDVSKAEIKKK